ncbi:hypothetical protein ACWCXX_30120 [Streptomyces sp. NPDC001732]
MGGVVLGHWLLVSVTYRSGHLSGLDALQYVGWGCWLTLLLQVMPVFFVAVTLYPTGVMPQPAIGSARWWALRPAWIALLAALLVPITAGVMRARQPLRLLPAGQGAAGWWSPVLVLCALGAVVPALTRLAIGGFAPSGHVPVLLLTTYACGLLAALYSGRPSVGQRG